MRQLHDIASTHFLLVRDADSVKETRRLLKELKQITHLIVWRQEDERDFHYLVPRDTALYSLSRWHDDDALHQALQLATTEPTQTVDAYTNSQKAPNYCIMLQDGFVAGFFDAEQGFPDGRRGPRLHGEAEQDLVQCSLETSFPGEVTVDVTASLLVGLSTEPDGERKLAEPLRLGTTVDIVIRAVSGFEIEGRSEGSILVSEPPQEPIRFKLRAVNKGRGELRIYAYLDAQPIGFTVLTPVVVDQPATSVRADSYRQAFYHVIAEQPDLALIIQQRKEQNQHILDLRLTAADTRLNYYLTPVGSVSLGDNPQEYFHQFYQIIDSLRFVDEPSRTAAEIAMAAKGTTLFERLPEQLRAELWCLRNRIVSVHIQSEEPWIPWELCRLYGKDGIERTTEDGFLCEQFALTRWPLGIGPKTRFRLKKIALIVPQDSGLPAAQEECDLVRSLIEDSGEVHEIPATLERVRDELISGTYTVIHFVGHGTLLKSGAQGNESVNYQQGIGLTDYQQLTPDHISGEVKNLGIAEPLVFFNACSTGRTFMTLSQLDGWAHRFLSAGAAGFVGALWKTRDEMALRFTEKFYSSLRSGTPIGRAVQEARLAARKSYKGDPTWLAYTVFAHPLAAVA